MILRTGKDKNIYLILWLHGKPLFLVTMTTDQQERKRQEPNSDVRSPHPFPFPRPRSNFEFLKIGTIRAQGCTIYKWRLIFKFLFEFCRHFLQRSRMLLVVVFNTSVSDFSGILQIHSQPVTREKLYQYNSTFYNIDCRQISFCFTLFKL